MQARRSSATARSSTTYRPINISFTRNPIPASPQINFAFSEGRTPASAPYVLGGSLNPKYVPELIPINASNVALNSRIVRSQITDVVNTPLKTIVHRRMRKNQHAICERPRLYG